MHTTTEKIIYSLIQQPASVIAFRKGQSMTRSKQGPRKELKELITKLEKSFERWSYLMTTGGSDPGWADGTNANLVRNHITYYKNEIIELCSENHYPLPEIINQPTPEQVPDSWMTRADDIRTDSQKSLITLEKDADYLYLNDIINALPGRIVHESSINNVLGYVRSLKRAIKEDDLVIMRRMRNPENYLESFHSCAIRIRRMTEGLNLKKQAAISDSEKAHSIKPLHFSNPVKPQITKQLDFSSFIRLEQEDHPF